MPVALTRSVSFHGRHRLARPGRTEGENHAEFGALSVGHPHDYTCHVTVSGPPAPGTGMVMDLALLDRILADEVTDRFGGRDLNETLPAVRSGAALAVCETIALELFGRIGPRLPAGVELERVLVAEDATLSAECRR